ncbi:5'/3'-nucleotidase SurE [Polaribacter sp.]|nr:5'/3'-nucleotidase SurE [Polaribacter sp.]
MQKKPLILITNDDGITAPGIRTLIKIMNKIGDVVVVAPDSPQSGMGHAITIDNVLHCNPITIDDGPQLEYTCSGTPADCVKMAVSEILNRKPDLCVSGINHGSNSSINVIYSGTMSAAVEAGIEGIPASWFSILNSFYIITFAPLFSKLWESKYNPSAPVKFGAGLILLGLGFGILAYGSLSIPQGAQTASVSMIFLILAYLLHTLGELTLSPVGLSYVSKLVPAAKIGLMYGLWYIAIGMGNKAAGSMGGMIDQITAAYSMSTFFLIFTFVPVFAGLILIGLSPIMKKLMHGIK